MAHRAVLQQMEKVSVQLEAIGNVHKSNRSNMNLLCEIGTGTERTAGTEALILKQHQSHLH
jgi:hypothetical protein